MSSYAIYCHIHNHTPGHPGDFCPKCSGTCAPSDAAHQAALHALDDARAANKEMGDALERIASALKVTAPAQELARMVEQRISDAAQNQEISRLQAERIRELLMLLGKPHAPHIVKQN